MGSHTHSGAELDDLHEVLGGGYFALGEADDVYVVFGVLAGVEDGALV